jgi:hypothetical protein
MFKEWNKNFCYFLLGIDAEFVSMHVEVTQQQKGIKIMTSITFNNDKDRENFIISMALTGLRNEVKYNHIVCHPSKGTTVKTLARYFTGLKKTRKAAYKQLVDAGIYDLLDKK